MMASKDGNYDGSDYGRKTFAFSQLRRSFYSEKLVVPMSRHFRSQPMALRDVTQALINRVLGWDTGPNHFC